MSVSCAGFSYRWSPRTAWTVALVLTLTTTPEIVAVYNQSSAGSLQRLPDSFMVAPSVLPVFLENAQWAVPALLSSSLGLKHDGPIAVVQRPSQDQLVGHSELGSTSSGMLIKYVVRIDGMACEACASRLRQHFSRQQSIERANVFFEDKKLVLWTQAGSGSMLLSERVIQDMVAQVDAKYTAQLEDTFSFASIE
ncbi:hypothetical protein BGW39_009197 [Mortierella sp. 14UC]|nr:hypothetical protein BGW39_009197 [Mortierella sp. 14UC]